MVRRTGAPLQDGTDDIVCDEEGSSNPVFWRGRADAIGSDYSVLLSHHENGLITVTENHGQIEIRGRDRVGVIHLPSGRRVRLRTKIPGIVLLDWLVYLREFPDLQIWENTGQISQSDVWPAVLARLFLQELDVVTRCHMRKGFVHLRTESPQVRGRIRSRQMAQRLWRLPSIPQVVRARSLNTPANQMLASALDRMLLFYGDLNGDQQALFRQLRHSWSEVSRSIRDRQAIIQASLATPPDGYRSALQLARLLLTGASIDPACGQGGDAFTISLFRLWENAVTEMCRELSSSTGWMVASRTDSIRRWDDAVDVDDPNRSMIADTHLQRGSERWVLDAKYKRSFGNESRNDRFQMCAYAVGFDAIRATLIYPFSPGYLASQRTLLNTTYGNKPLMVDAIALPMGDGPKVCKQRLLEHLTRM